MAETGSWLRIGPHRYDCSGAQAVCSFDEEGVTMELYSFDPKLVSDDLFETSGGMTINGVVWRGAQSVQELVGRQALQLTIDDDPELVGTTAGRCSWDRGRP